MPRFIRASLTLCIAALLAACQPMQLFSKPHPNGQPAATDSEVAAAATPRVPAARQAQSVPQVSFLLGQDQPASNLAQLPLSATRSIYVLPQAVLTRADLVHVEPVVNDTQQAFVVFTFSDGGAQKLAAISRQHAGRYLAIVVNGSLVALPKLGSALNDGILGVPVSDRQTADAIARAVAGR